MTKLTPLFSEKESKTLEFKSKLPNFINLIKTCIAFANGIGGKIIIGIDDKTRQSIGIEDKERDRLYDDFPSSLYDSTSPSLFAQIYEQRFDDLSVLIIEIPLSPKKPYFLKIEGIPNGIYVRAGSNTRRATPEYIEDLMRESKRINFDEEIVQEDVSILSKELISGFYRRQGNIKRMITDKIIAISAANREKYFPTVTGILFFCENPHHFIPEATIICTRFKGDSAEISSRHKNLQGLSTD